jgi:hypothetical protein
MSRSLTFPATIPVRNVTEAELAASARASMPLQAGRRLADWFGEAPVDAESAWPSARAQRDAALTLGLVAGGDAMTDETASRLRWIYEVAYHAGYLHTSEDHELIHRAAELAGGAQRTDTAIIGDWCRGLDALFAHGVEDALPPGADPAPLDFHGIGNVPVFKLLEQHGTATTGIISAAIAEGATEGMMPSSARKQWTAWTARHGDPTAAFLQLAAEFGVVTVDGPAVSLTPLGAWAVIQQLGATTEVLPAPAELTPRQLIICRLGMSGEAFEAELRGWLAAREPAAAVSALLEAGAEADDTYLATGVQIAARIEGDTEAAWRSAMSLPAIRPYAVAELNRRAGRDPRRDPLPGLEPYECDTVVMASRAIVAGYATGGADGVAAAVRRAAVPGSETVLFEQMWRSRHAIANQALMTAGKLHPDKKIAKAARAALVKAASVRNSPRGR